MEYAGDDASYHSDPGKATTSVSGQQSAMASEEIQPLWTAQLRASLTQIYEKCSVQVPTPLQRSSLVRPLLAASTASDLETVAPTVAPPETVAAKSEQQGPQSSESDLINNVA